MKTLDVMLLVQGIMVNWWFGIRNRKGFVTAITPYNLTILSQSFYMVLKSKHISFFYFQNNMRNFIISGQISTTIIIICYRLESLRLKTSNLKFMIKLCRPRKVCEDNRHKPLYQWHCVFFNHRMWAVLQILNYLFSANTKTITAYFLPRNPENNYFY